MDHDARWGGYARQVEALRADLVGPARPQPDADVLHDG